MPATAFLRAGASRLAPLVLTCEHASRRLPPGYPRDPASSRLLRTHWASDLGAWPVARALAERFRTSAVGGRWSRLVIDLNRQVGDPTLIRAEAGGVPLPWNRRATPAEVERRVMDYHVPYHAEIDRLIVRRLVRGVQPLILAVHTFTPELGRARRRFDAGVLFEDHAGLARLLAAGLRARGLSVRYNEPYSGRLGMMYAADRHGSHHRLPCLEVEINQALVASPRGVARMVRALAPAVGEVLAKLRG